jgi:hypothetical protein
MRKGEAAMSDEWQPVETAPIDVQVRLGGWSVFNDRLDWRQSDGVAWTRGFFGGRKRTYYGENYAYWMPLPPPPTTLKGEE